MNNHGKLLAAGFYKAWEYLIDYPLPPMPLHLRSRLIPKDRLVLAFFPVIGFLLGVVPVILGTLGRWFFNPVAGALLFTASAIVILIGKDSGRGVALWCSFIMLRIFGLPEEMALRKMSSNPAALLNEARFSSALVFLIFLIAADFFLLGIAGAMSALPAIFAGDAFIQAQLATENDANSKVPRLDNGGLPMSITPAVVIAVLWLIAQPKLGTLVAIGLFILFRQNVKKRFGSENGGVSADEITLCGFTAAVMLSILSLTILSFH